jgi:uroporphyrinogen decarboxylase
MALRHTEPDTVPIDLGGTPDSSICAPAYKKLREHLGLGSGSIRVADVVQQQVLVEEDVRQAVGSDVVGVQYEPAKWRLDQSIYDFPILVPDQFRPQVLKDGSQVTLDSAGHVLLKLPSKGDFFYPVYAPLAEATCIGDLDKHMDDIETFDRSSFLDRSYEDLAQVAKNYYENTDYLVSGLFGAHIFAGAEFLRGFENFLLDLVANPTFAEALMDRLVQVNVLRFEKYAQTVGKYLHIVHVEDDLGMQSGPFVSLELYRKLVKPYHKRMYALIKSKCNAFISLHSDGAVSSFIPDLIEIGVDALNPVQYTAKGMDTQELKREFGKDITFWGGGCDTQRVLPFGTTQEVKDEVRKRIDDLAPGGGFVFAAIHNITAGVPAENIVAMYDTAREYGVY